MRWKKFLILPIIISFTLGYFYSGISVSAQTSPGTSTSLAREIDFWLGEKQASAFLLWQYSGDSSTNALGPGTTDKWSFFKGDPLCTVMKQKAEQYPGKLGVNIHKLQAFPDKIGPTLDYLKNECGTTIVRIFGVQAYGADAVLNLLNIAEPKGIKIIVAAIDFNTQIFSDTDTQNVVTGWYRSTYSQQYLPYLRELASKISNHPALMYFELSNEAHCAGDGGCIEPYVNWVGVASSIVKEPSGDVKVGIGQKASEESTRGDSPGVGDFLVSNSVATIDVTSGHYYTSAERAEVSNAAGISQQIDKPFYIGEVGATLFSSIEQPPPYKVKEVPCNETTYPEFHSLRPYPASPCDENVQGALLCGNDLYIKQKYALYPEDAGPGKCITQPDDSKICDYELQGSARISLDLSKAEFPIMGNTQRVPNSVNQAVNISFAQRMNEYVSWFLNGVDHRAEELPTTSIDDLINLSGPLKKLLPSRIATGTYNDLVAPGFAKPDGVFRIKQIKDSLSDERHNQIYACALSGNPAACYREQDNEQIRLENLDRYPKFNQYAPFSSTEDLVGEVSIDKKAVQSPSISNITLQTLSWNAIRPNQKLYFAHMQEDYELAGALQKTYLPAGLPTDAVNATGVGPNDDTEVITSTSVPNPADIPYCEILDTRSNPGDYLYGEFTTAENPSYIDGSFDFKTNLFKCVFPPPIRNFQCEDDCSKGQAKACGISKCVQEQGLPIDQCLDALPCWGKPPDLPVEIPAPTDYRPTPGSAPINVPKQCKELCQKEVIQACEKDILIGATVKTRTPKADEAWARLVNGPTAIFKRMFPKIGPQTPVDKILDIPGKSYATYQQSPNSALTAAKTLTSTDIVAGSPDKSKAGNNAEIFFPHIGGIYDYFLKKIQVALRPKTLQSTSTAPPPLPPISQEAPGESTHEQTQCTFQNTAFSCAAGSCSTSTAPILDTSISKGLVTLALSVSKYTCTPAEIIIGVLAKETKGRTVTQFGQNQQEALVTGDPNQQIARSFWCQDEYNARVPGTEWYAFDCGGAFYMSQSRFDQQVGSYSQYLNECLQNVQGSNGSGSLTKTDGQPDARKVGVSACVGSGLLWEGLRGRSTCDKKAHSIDEFSEADIRAALVRFHGANDAEIPKYMDLINQYSGYVNQVRGDTASCQI